MPNLTKIDRFALSVKHDHEAIRSFLSGTYAHIGEPSYEHRGGGHGFDHSALVTLGGAQVAWMGWGGSAQKGRSYVDLSGLGCGLVVDWQRVQDALEQLPEVRAKRIDIAADFYRGEVSYEQVLAAYHEGKFNRVHGRPPKMSQILPGQSHEGRTVYIGKRGNDVMLRAYEKGKKEFGDLPASVQAAGFRFVSTHDDDGISVGFEDWLRVELELRSKTRPLDLEVIPQRDQYFAGAYPYLQHVLPNVEPQILVRPEHIAEADLVKALELIRRQWGSTLFTALTVHHGDIFAVWKRICGREHNERLLHAGVLLLRDRFACDDPAEQQSVATESGP